MSNCVVQSSPQSADLEQSEVHSPNWTKEYKGPTPPSRLGSWFFLISCNHSERAKATTRSIPSSLQATTTCWKRSHSPIHSLCLLLLVNVLFNFHYLLQFTFSFSQHPPCLLVKPGSLSSDTLQVFLACLQAIHTLLHSNTQHLLSNHSDLSLKHVHIISPFSLLHYNYVKYSESLSLSHHSSHVNQCVTLTPQPHIHLITAAHWNDNTNIKIHVNCYPWRWLIGFKRSSEQLSCANPTTRPANVPCSMSTHLPW